MHTPLDIKNTPNCQPHPWHPSVIYVPEGWSGHKWWMAQTPFPPFNLSPYRDRYELPCIHYSDDGKKWIPIHNNPIDDLDEEMIEAHNYYSDPHLLLNRNKLECYYRTTYLFNKQPIGNKTVLVKKTSTDGITWSDRAVIADLRKKEDIVIWGEQIISPAVILHESTYYCWYVDRSGYLYNRKILLCTSVDEKKWSTRQECTINGPNIDPWHIDVQYYNGCFQMIVYDHWGLYWYQSIDGINFEYLSTIAVPSPQPTDFYHTSLYRACSVWDGQKAWVFFPGHNGRKAFIGLLQTTDSKHFEKINGIPPIIHLLKNFLPGASGKEKKQALKRYIKQILK